MFIWTRNWIEIPKSWYMSSNTFSSANINILISSFLNPHITKLYILPGVISNMWKSSEFLSVRVASCDCWGGKIWAVNSHLKVVKAIRVGSPLLRFVPLPLPLSLCQVFQPMHSNVDINQRCNHVSQSKCNRPNVFVSNHKTYLSKRYINIFSTTFA